MMGEQDFHLQFVIFNGDIMVLLNEKGSHLAIFNLNFASSVNACYYGLNVVSAS